MILFWTLVSLAGLWMATMIFFIAIMHCKKLLDDQTEEFTLFWKIHIVPIGIVGVVLDILFNIFIGSVIFLERPHELLFTARCARHKRYVLGQAVTWRMRLARFMCRQLNQIDPGHC